MLRDIRYFFYEGNDCGKIINAISNDRYNSLLRTQIAVYQIHSGGFGILSSSDEVDEIIKANGGVSKPDAAAENIRNIENAYPFVFGERELRKLLQYLIPVSPRNCMIRYKEGKEYLFSSFNITDEIRADAQGVYLFTIVKEDNPQKRPLHVIIGFASVNSNNYEVISDYKKKGAGYFLYYYSGAEWERREIIDNIKSSEDYRYQLECYPDISRFEE